MLSLTNGPFALDFTPEFGGSVRAFTASGVNILRPSGDMTPNHWDTRESAAFPMVPFIGRITNGCFRANDKSVQLPANMPPEPHAIHGFGWQRAWTVLDASDTHAVVEHAYNEVDWPWPYRAQQIFKLTEHGLTVTLFVQNQGETPMPTGLGWHPYFPSHATTLLAPVTQSWTGLNKLPERTELTSQTDLRFARPVQSLNLDTAFDCEQAPISIETDQHTLTLTSDPIFSKLTVYHPKDTDFFCVEPVSHAPDAINMNLSNEETGLVWLSPGETLQGDISLHVKPHRADVDLA
ncbi:MAG: aldose 1-epimerase [Pseudomonadota bacterium]